MPRPYPSGISVGRDAAFSLALFVTGLLINLVFARMGFQPLDMSIVFDGGWRILDGQVPFRDFLTPYGVVPAAMQAIFFAIAGCTWFAFCLHSSVVNGAFAVVLYLLLVVLRLPRPLAFFYALCACFFFYPPVGVPFMEQHSFFFSLAAIAAAAGGTWAQPVRVQAALWAAVPALSLLAYLSKPVPFVFTSPALLVLLCLPGRASLSRRAIALVTGAATVAIAVLLIVVVLRIPPAVAYDYTVVRPREVGGVRAGPGEILERISRRYDNLPEAMGLVYIKPAVLLYRGALLLSPVMLAIWLAGRKRDPGLGDDVSILTSALLLAPICYGSSMALGFVANNQTQNSVAFYPIGAALLHAAVAAELRIVHRGLRLLAASRPALTRIDAGRYVTPLMITALVAISIGPVRHWVRDTVTWTTEIDMTRMVNDMTFDQRLALDSKAKLAPGMEFLRWTPSPAQYDLDGWTALIAFLRARNRPFLILGDTLVTYGLVGQPSIAPNLWFHPGVTVPEATDPRIEAYERELIARIRSGDVRCVVVEGDATRLGFSVDHLPALRAWLTSEWAQTRTFGPNRVYER